MFGISKAVLYFIAGAAFWEAFVHIDLQLLGMVPFKAWGYTITPQLNMVIVLGAIALCVFLVAVARRMACDCERE